LSGLTVHRAHYCQGSLFTSFHRAHYCQGSLFTSFHRAHYCQGSLFTSLHGAHYCQKSPLGPGARCGARRHGWRSKCGASESKQTFRRLGGGADPAVEPRPRGKHGVLCRGAVAYITLSGGNGRVNLTEPNRTQSRGATAPRQAWRASSTSRRQTARSPPRRRGRGGSIGVLVGPDAAPARVRWLFRIASSL
jgi:hypothetical protein